jgi:hypothetical protein
MKIIEADRKKEVQKEKIRNKRKSFKLAGSK